MTVLPTKIGLVARGVEVGRPPHKSHKDWSCTAGDRVASSALAVDEWFLLHSRENFATAMISAAPRNAPN